MTVFDGLLFAHYGIKLNEKEQKWFAIDGTELRGSIETGCRRGEAIVQAVAHEDLQVAAQEYYAGAKESEKWRGKRSVLMRSIANPKL